MKLSYPAVYVRLKRVIAERKRGVSPHDIRASSKLVDAPLRFTNPGKVALKGYLEAEFSAEGLTLKESQLEAANTIKDIAKAIHKKIGK